MSDNSIWRMRERTFKRSQYNYKAQIKHVCRENVSVVLMLIHQWFSAIAWSQVAWNRQKQWWCMFVLKTIMQITIGFRKLATFLWNVAQNASNKRPSLVYMSVGMQMTDYTILTACCHWSDNEWCYTLITQRKCILLKWCILKILQMHPIKKKLSRTSYNNSHSIRFLSFTTTVINISIDYGHLHATSPCPIDLKCVLTTLVDLKLLIFELL